MRKNLSIEGGKNLFTMLAKDLQLLDRIFLYELQNGHKDV